MAYELSIKHSDHNGNKASVFFEVAAEETENFYNDEVLEELLVHVLRDSDGDVKVYSTGAEANTAAEFEALNILDFELWNGSDLISPLTTGLRLVNSSTTVDYNVAIHGRTK